MVVASISDSWTASGASAAIWPEQWPRRCVHTQPTTPTIAESTRYRIMSKDNTSYSSMYLAFVDPGA